MAEQQWYTNKELYEMINDFKLSLTQTKIEMQNTQKELLETQKLVREYNGLRRELMDTRRRVEAWEQRARGRMAVADGIRAWGGWILAILSFVWTLYKTLK